jgi:TrkA domain protein
MQQSPSNQPPLTSVMDEALPGIGHRYELRSVDGARIVVVVHHSGRRDVYTFTDGEGPQSAVVEEIEAVICGLLIDWITLEPDARGVGRTIDELGIRKSTGITVVAMLRDHTPLISHPRRNAWKPAISWW